MEVKEALGGAGLEARLAAEILQNATSSTNSAPKFQTQSSLNTNKFQVWMRAAQDSATAVGNMPPASATWRARFGAVLVRLVRRMLFWYTPQIISFNTAALGAMQEQGRLVERLHGLIEGLHGENEQLRGDNERLRGELEAQRSELSAAVESAAEQARQIELRAIDRDREQREELLEVLRREIRARERAEQHIVSLEAQVQSIPPEIQRNDQQLLSYIKGGDADRVQIRWELEQRFESAKEYSAELRTMLFALERRIGATAESNSTPSPSHTPEVSPALDNLYLLLENRLRGSRQEIKQRLTEYLPRIESAPVLDLGCGRGEWLELLRDHGLHAYGADLNATFVDSCQRLGLEVHLEDAVACLRRHENASLGAVTGFHIVEHLPWATLVELADETLRALKPGGVVIFETPNPDNVWVGTRNFYYDPTHRNPVPSLLLQFLLEARGFTRVDILNLHPWPESQRVAEDGSEMTKRFNEYFYGPQDYAVIARKA